MTDEESDRLEAKRRVILDEKRNVTGRMSETTRFVAFGLLAVYYAIRTASEGFGFALQTKFPVHVALVGVFGAAAVLLDYLQYWFGSHAVNEALRRPTVDYDRESLWYVARKVTFAAKQIAAVAGALMLVILFAAA